MYVAVNIGTYCSGNMVKKSVLSKMLLLSFGRSVKDVFNVGKTHILTYLIVLIEYRFGLINQAVFKIVFWNVMK